MCHSKYKRSVEAHFSRNEKINEIMVIGQPPISNDQMSHVKMNGITKATKVTQQRRRLS